MALTDRTKELDRIQKILCVDIVATHKTDRTGGVLDTATLRITDGRFAIDSSGNQYEARLLPGYRRVRTTGTDSGSGSLLGTGIGPGTAPNTLSFSVNAAEDLAGNSLRSWQDYQLQGATVIARMGAVHDEHGAAIDFDDFEEEWYGFVKVAPRTSDDVWQIQCVSPEGYRQDAPLVRRTYRGYGYGVRLDNSATAPLGTADAWLAGSGSAAFAPTSGKYSWGAILSVDSLPSAVGDTGVLFRLEVGGAIRLQVRFRSADDALNVVHNDGTTQTGATFDWDLSNVTVGEPFQIGCRFDAAEVHLYLASGFEESVALARDVGTGGIDVEVGRQTSSAQALDCTVYEVWLGNDDVGDTEMRRRLAGPLRGDAENQTDLWMWHEFLEGGQLVPPSTTADLRFEVELTLGGTAAFLSSLEGDHPDVSPKPHGMTQGHVIGKCFNVPGTPLESALAIFEAARSDADSFDIRAARLDGAPAQVAFHRDGTWIIQSTDFEGLEDADLALLAIPRGGRTTPIKQLTEVEQLRQLQTGGTGQQGSEVDIFGDGGIPTNDGQYEVIAVRQKLYVELQAPIGQSGYFGTVTGMPREDLTASCEVTMPIYRAGEGSPDWDDTLDGSAAVDLGGGLVALPATAHGLTPAITRIKVTGSTNYSGKTYQLQDDDDGDRLVVEETFTSETFAGTETVAASVAQVTDLSASGRVQMSRLPTATLTLDVEGKAIARLREIYTHLRNARDRAEGTAVYDASYTLDENFTVTWVGDAGERDESCGLAAPGGQDLKYRDALGRLLRSYFAWSSDAERALIGPTLAPQVRMGHFGAPASGGTVYHGRLVTSEQVEELATEPPAWRLTASYRPNYHPINSPPAGVAPAARERLQAEFSEIEVARSEATRTDFDGARDILWHTLFFDAERAALVGQRAWDFVSVVRLWRRWQMALLPSEVDVGSDFTVEGGSHDELAPTAGTDVHFFPATIEDGITSRGVVLVCIS